MRDEEVIIPRRETVVEEGDHVILFSLADDVEEVEGLFRESSGSSRD